MEWTEAGGFGRDSLGNLTPALAWLLESERQVCGTPTGPCFPAAEQPGHVALLTAVSIFDHGRYEVEGGEEYVAELERLGEVPEGAIS